MTILCLFRAASSVIDSTSPATGVVIEERREEPHSEQNFDVGRSSEPQFEHVKAGAAKKIEYTKVRNMKQ